MKKLIGLFILLMTVLTENSFAAVDQWKHLDVPGSQECLFINEIKKSEPFAGQMLTTITLLIDLSGISDYRFVVLREIAEDGFYLSDEEDLSEEVAFGFLENDSNGEVPW